MSPYFCPVNTIAEINPSEYPNFKHQLLRAAESFGHASILISNNYTDKYGKFELLAAFGANRIIKGGNQPFEDLKIGIDERNSWLFGHLAYDLKNSVENLTSRNPKQFVFPELSFFEPQFLFQQKRGEETIHVLANPEADRNEILKHFKKKETLKNQGTKNFPEFKPKQSKREYIKAIERLKEHIQLGNIYEINYCQEFFAEDVIVNPSELFDLLSGRSPMPFSTYYKHKNNYVIGASPERFLCKRGNKIYSQPIKGTAKRGKNADEDEKIKANLKQDLKEQTENVMIVDLVRNDLSRTAEKGSVKVEELFGVYTFPQVHQLISTVSSQLANQFHFVDAIKSAFPMGSMTGAPKVSAMKIADELELSRRELYSGSIGYIEPNGDFDFNVVIRSLLYSESSKYLSLTVGGAITNLSEPEKEYEECLLKAKAIFELGK